MRELREKHEKEMKEQKADLEHEKEHAVKTA
jgi:hypothetical protein